MTDVPAKGYAQVPSGDESWRQQALLSAARERGLSLILMVYIITGLIFMLLPGTFLGVWNLLSISSGRAPDSVSPGWIQAHGHAQIFGWIGTFILGIGFYSIPKLRRPAPFALSEAWICWAIWTAGVSLRWSVGIYEWRWRALLPLSAALELAAFLLFFRSVAGHRPAAGSKKGLESWVVVVVAGTIGLLATLLLNLGESIYLVFSGDGPAFPRIFDQRFLVLTVWGFLVPFVWGFSARWMPAFLGLKPMRNRLLLVSLAVNGLGVIAATIGWTSVSSMILLLGSACATAAIRLFEPAKQPAKTRGVSTAFPAFVRTAYVWLLISASLAIWAAFRGESGGITGASRHALTVGFLSTMVFCVGPRVLPAFTGLRLLYSPKLMSAALALLSIGCALRVSSEIIAYQGYSTWAWRWLPVSAVIELTAVAVFALNMAITFTRKPIIPKSQISIA